MPQALLPLSRLKTDSGEQVATPSNKPAALQGWWLDALILHMDNRFFGEIEVEIFMGRVMSVEATELLDNQTKGAIEPSDPIIEAWWLDSLTNVMLQQYTGSVKLKVKNGAVTIMKVKRRYTKSEVDAGRVHLCRKR